MATIPEQLQAVLHDVEAVLEENKRLNAALAKANAQLFDLQKAQGRQTQEGFLQACLNLKPGESLSRSYEMKPSGVARMNVVSFDKKNGTLEDDVKRFLGIAPYQNDKAKNDGKFVAKLDKAYGQAQVDAMIQRLRGV